MMTDIFLSPHGSIILILKIASLQILSQRMPLLTGCVRLTISVPTLDQTSIRQFCFYTGMMTLPEFLQTLPANHFHAETTVPIMWPPRCRRPWQPELFGRQNGSPGSILLTR